MKKNRFRQFSLYQKVLILMMLIIPPVTVVATRATIGNEVKIEDDDDADVRTGPVNISGAVDDAPLVEFDLSQYPFLNLNDNVIVFNGDDWSDLRGRFENIDDTIVSIVHIGDSHLQADIATARTRTLLQSHYGSSGRGLIVPLKLARTNQPTDYTITSDDQMTAATMMRIPYATAMGFTGVSIEPHGSRFAISITTKPSYGISQEFDCIRLYGRGTLPRVESVRSSSGNIKFEQLVSGDTLAIMLNDYTDNVNLQFKSEGKCNIFGFKLENSMMGVEYHVIGNNGARYDTYNKIGGIGESITSLSPNLVIVSLGANEAYGRISDAAFYNNIDILVKDIRDANPDAHIMLVTPGPCQKKYSGTYGDNLDVRRLRDVIMNYCSDNGIAVYDWYSVAGATEGSEAMLTYGLLGKDRIHNTMEGYKLQGELFYNALIKAIEDKDE